MSLGETEKSIDRGKGRGTVKEEERGKQRCRGGRGKGLLQITLKNWLKPKEDSPFSQEDKDEMLSK